MFKKDKSEAAIPRELGRQAIRLAGNAENATTELAIAYVLMFGFTALSRNVDKETALILWDSVQADMRKSVIKLLEADNEKA